MFMIRFTEKLGAVSTIGIKIHRDVHSHGLLLFKDGTCVREKFLDDDKVYLTIRIEGVMSVGTTETIYVDMALLQNENPQATMMAARRALVAWCIAELKDDLTNYLNSVGQEHASSPVILGEKK